MNDNIHRYRTYTDTAQIQTEKKRDSAQIQAGRYLRKSHLIPERVLTCMCLYAGV
jgi:hypothetical protein